MSMNSARLLVAVAAAVGFWATPATAQTPAPACSLPINYVVFFAWGRSNLNGVAVETLNDAVDYTRKCEIRSVVLFGHAAKSDPPDDQGLSERRVSGLRDALVARGVLPSVITVQLVDDDPEKQPLNREGEVDPNSGVVIRFSR